MEINNDNVPAKIKRLNPENNNDCEELKQFFDDKINEVKDIIRSQNEAVMEALTIQNALIKTLIEQQTKSGSLELSFPLSTVEDLKEVDDKICDENKAFYIDTMKTMLCGNPKKKLLAILTSDLVLEFNTDGTHGKKRLKDFSKFYSVLKDSFFTDTQTDPEDTLRKAMQIVKKTHYHSECIKKKSSK